MSSAMDYLAIGAISVAALAIYSQQQKNSHQRKIDNKVDPPPTIRTPVGGYNFWYGYFPSTGSSNKNSIL